MGLRRLQEHREGSIGGRAHVYKSYHPKNHEGLGTYAINCRIHLKRDTKKWQNLQTLEL